MGQMEPSRPYLDITQTIGGEFQINGGYYAIVCDSLGRVGSTECTLEFRSPADSSVWVTTGTIVDAIGIQTLRLPHHLTYRFNLAKVGTRVYMIPAYGQGGLF